MIKELLKTIEHKGEKYEIMLVKENGKWFLQDFKNGHPYSPYRYEVSDKVSMLELESKLGRPVLDYLISAVEDGIYVWVENKDKFNKRSG
jgi:hypothetical protein